MYRENWLNPGVKGITRRGNSARQLTMTVVANAVHPERVEKMKKCVLELAKYDLKCGKLQMRLSWKELREKFVGANLNDVRELKAELIKLGFKLTGPENISWKHLSDDDRGRIGII